MSTIVIVAGNKPMYEVEKSEDGMNVSIRHANQPERKIEIIGSAVPELIKALEKLALYR